MNILITGGAGFLGQHLVYALKEKYPQANITIIDLKPNPHPLHNLEKLGVRIIYGKNILDIEGISTYFCDQDYVFNLVGLVSFWEKHKELLYSINAESVKNVICLCNKYKVKKLIHISSVASLGYSNNKNNPINEDYKFPFETTPNKHYMLSKKKGEDYIIDAIKKHNLKATIACPALMWGAGDFSNTAKVIKAIKNRKMLFNMCGGTYVADAQDIAQGLIAVLEKGKIGAKYILGGYNYTFKKMNRIISEILGITPPKITIPRSFHSSLYYLAKAYEKLTKNPPQLTSDNVDSAFMYRYFNNDMANRELNWKIQKPFQQTIKDQIQYLKCNNFL